jgi:hypothetical protein
MGKKFTPEEAKKGDESELDSDSDPEIKDAAMDSDDSDDSSESDEENDRGTDLLQSSHKLDIPIVRDIPILSQLAKKEKAAQAPKVSKKADEIMQVDELEIETHFVENPFIRTRERANRK